MTINNPTQSISRPAMTAETLPTGDNAPAAGGPAADLLALLDELAARGRALRLQAEGGAVAPRPESETSAAASAAREAL